MGVMYGNGEKRTIHKKMRLCGFPMRRVFECMGLSMAIPSSGKAGFFGYYIPLDKGKVLDLSICMYGTPYVWPTRPPASSTFLCMLRMAFFRQTYS